MMKTPTETAHESSSRVQKYTPNTKMTIGNTTKLVVCVKIMRKRIRKKISRVLGYALPSNSDGTQSKSSTSGHDADSGQQQR